jgi:hypothetical protein
MSARRAALAGVLVAALAIVPGGLAAGSISTTTTSIASGDSFTVEVCVGTDGDGGYLLVKGPNTFQQDVFFGPVTGCSDVSVTTVGWAPGRYRITGYEFTPKRTTGLGSITLTVT